MIPSLQYDALVAGGGVAGSALAISLARAGRAVILVERSRSAQHKVCGEFLSPESLPGLREIGIDPEELGAQAIHTVRLAARDVFSETPFPASALSLTRKTLDEALLGRARQAGVSLVRGYTVESLSYSASGNVAGIWRAEAMNAATQAPLSICADSAFLATGKHDLRKWRRATDGSQNTLVAMKMYFALAPRQQAELAGHVELILFPGGYAGLQPVEGGWANLCALVTRDKLRLLGSHWNSLLNHMRGHSGHLARRLSGAIPMLDRPLALSAIPYGFCTGGSMDEPSPWRLGDQAAVIPSFCGDGMAIALHTARRAAHLYLEGADSSHFHAEMRHQLERRVYFSTMLSRLLIAMPSFAQAARLCPSVVSTIFTVTRVPGD